MKRDRAQQLSLLLIAVLWVVAAVFTALTIRAVLSDDEPVASPRPEGAGETTTPPATPSPTTTPATPSPTTPPATPSPTTTPAAPSPTTTPATPSPATTPTTPSSTTTPATPPPAPGETRSVAPDGLPTDGPGISEPGVLMVIAPSTGGSFDVTEQVRLPSAINVVELAPAQLSGAGSQFDDAEPVATTVQLSTDGQPIVVPDGTVAAPVSIPVDGITQFELSYQLDGTTVRSVPATARRALAAISPLIQATPGDLPVAVVIVGPVLGVNCPLLTLAEQSCGVGSAPMLQVDRVLPLDDAVVTVQLDLPRA